MTSDRQMELFGAAAAVRPGALGHASVAYRDTASILTKASGFMSDFDFTLNPRRLTRPSLSHPTRSLVTTSSMRHQPWRKPCSRKPARRMPPTSPTTTT